MFVIGFLVALMVAGVVALATGSPRGIAVAAWIVGGAYAVFGLGAAVFLFVHHSEFGLVALASGLAAATGTLVHRRRPALGAGVLMAGGFVCAAGLGLLGAGLAAWGEASSGTVIVVGFGVALATFLPSLLTGLALIRGPKRLFEGTRL